MKKIALLFIAAVCSVNNFAQTWDNAKPDKRVTFGIRAGVNLSSTNTPEGYSYSYSYSTKMGMGFHAGINADINIIKSFAIQTGLMYSQQHCTITESSNREEYIDNIPTHYYDTYEYTIQKDYVMLPVLALCRFYLSNNIHIQVKAGGYAAYIFPKEDGIEVGSRFDWGAIVGAGISVKKFYLGARYEMGFHKKEGEKTSNIAISVGYDF
ncbi:MAG: PorT family protein [Prevotella sp.]|nr:PorT family protein [Prevotella sp.]